MRHRRFEIGLANNRCTRLRAESGAFLAIEMVVLPPTTGTQPIARSVAAARLQMAADFDKASVERNGPRIALIAGRNSRIRRACNTWLDFEITKLLRMFPL